MIRQLLNFTLRMQVLQHLFEFMLNVSAAFNSLYSYLKSEKTILPNASATLDMQLPCDQSA
jgi:hypothetical protein